MPYAIFSNTDDLTAVATRIRDTRLPNKVRQDGLVFWNGGLSGYQTAPRWPVAYPGYDADPNGKIIVMTGSSLDAFRTYLYTVSRDFPAIADWVRKAADTMADHWGAVEPWPYTPGLDPWEGFVRLPPTTTTTTTLPPPMVTTTTRAPG